MSVPDPKNPLLGGTSDQPQVIGTGVVVDQKPIKSGAEPLRGDAETTPSGQPIPPAGLDKTNIKTVEPGTRPTDTPPLNSQLEQQHADPRAVELVEAQQREKDEDKPVEVPFPLRPGDVIQGPGDRRNRRPKEQELKAGRDTLQYHLSDEELDALNSQKFKVIDPPIDEGAPKDQPADPRAVAESRGIKFPDQEKKPVEEPVELK